MRTLSHYLVYLVLGLWIGALVFFALILAPVAFGQLPPLFSDHALGIHAAGVVVGGTLVRLHWMGIICGVVFLAALAVGRAYYRTIIPPAILAIVMLVLTFYSQFSIIPRMDIARDSVGGSIEAVPESNPGRQIFDTLHKRSEEVEIGVLIVGLLTLLATAHLARGERRLPPGPA